MSKWDSYDIKYVKDHIGDKSVAEMACHLGRSHGAVRQWCSQNDLVINPAWTGFELNQVRFQLQSGVSIDVIAKDLQRTPNAIRSALSRDKKRNANTSN